MTSKRIECDLMVVGTGMAGVAAAAYASARGLSVAQTGMATSIMFAAGCFDLLGVHPVAEGCVHDDPFAALAALRQDQPDHPYSKLTDKGIHEAFDEFVAFTREAGLGVHMRPGKNMHFPTPLGTMKTTYCVPDVMIEGVRAQEDKTSCALVDVKGLKGYSSQQIAAVLGDQLNVVGTGQVVFPEMENLAEVYPMQMAMALENPRVRAMFIERLRQVVGDAEVVGLPAILGLYSASEVMDDISAQLGVKLFEIPTMPPGISGLRLKEAYEAALTKRGVKRLNQKQVSKAELVDGGFRFEVGAQWTQYEIYAKGCMLASGRFLGKGLQTERTRVVESVFGLPVAQPESRDEWHGKKFLDAKGHTLNTVGLETDDDFRPLGAHGSVVADNLFAVGSILAHQDWMRQKCGSGLAITTAHKAVKAFMKK